MWYKEVFYRLAIFGWKDAIEILCMTGGLYFFSTWLQHDKQKQLVTHFYALCSLVVIAHLTELPTLGSSLMSFFPAMIMLFILVHQKSLQNSFVALKKLMILVLRSSGLLLLRKGGILSQGGLSHSQTKSYVQN